MKKIILAGLFTSLIAAAPLQAMAASTTHKTAHKTAATSEQVRNARASVYSPQSDLSNGSARSYGWSAPAGR